MSELPAAIARRVQAAVRDAVNTFRTQAQAGPVTEKASLRHFANPVGQEEDPLLLPRCYHSRQYVTTQVEQQLLSIAEIIWA